MKRRFRLQTLRKNLQTWEPETSGRWFQCFSAQVFAARASSGGPM